MEHLLSYVANYYRLSTEAQDALYNSFEKITLSKNDYLLRQGKICRYLYFLEKGALRGYYDLDEKEVTHWFSF